MEKPIHTGRSNSATNQINPNSSDKLGAGIMSLLQPLPGERILDLGCGTGDLTAEIAAVGAVTTGIDLSEEMIRRAKAKYPELDFQVGDAGRYRTDAHYDAVFSHAALHWIKESEEVVRGIWQALRDGGRFVAEFAGSGNIAVLLTAIEQTLKANGYAPEGRNPWYHPTIGEYASLLEKNGFRVISAKCVDKLTPLKGDMGIQQWLASFDRYFFTDVNSADKALIYRTIEEMVKPQLYQNGQWTIDTSRLRVVAIKKSASSNEQPDQLC